MARTHRKSNGQKKENTVREIDISWMEDLGHIEPDQEPDGAFSIADLAQKVGVSDATARRRILRGLDAGSLEVVGQRRCGRGYAVLYNNKKGAG